MGRLRKIISSCLGIAAEKITDDFSFAENSEVDSFKLLLLLSTVEEEFKIKISIEEAMKLGCPNDYKKLLIKKGVKENEI